jgi:pimeloyl-ACP methyl ester carboxylesterase
MSMFDQPIAEQWRQFHATYAPRERCVGDVRWEYWAAGDGDETLVLLPGAPGRGETSFQYMSAFAGHYRVIAPSYPAIGTASALGDGLVALLRAEGIERAHMVGGSYSGLVAQCVLRRYPALVDRLVLSDTGVPDARRARRARALMRCVRALPFGLVRGLLKAGTYAFVQPMGADRPFWRWYFHSLLDALRRDDLVSRLAVAIDIDAGCRWTPWHGDTTILLLAAAGDRTFGADALAHLHTLYPQATEHVIEIRGHAGSLAAAPAYIAAIGAFLARTEATV